MRPGLRAFAWLSFALPLCCARALREPPPIETLSATSRHDAVDVDRLLAAAEQDWARREPETVRRAQQAWLAAAAADRQGIDGLIGATRAAVWLSGHEPTPEVRQQAALEAVQAAQLCCERREGEAACDYWLGVALGVQARERRATALDALPRMAVLLESAAARQPELEHGGPDRVLALLLLRAPGWPTGPGDPERGLERARRAMAIEPDYPPNVLCLAEALTAAGEREAGKENYERGARMVRDWIDRGEPDARDWLDDAGLAPQVPPGYNQQPPGGAELEEDT